jgi:hypothetical protein
VADGGRRASGRWCARCCCSVGDQEGARCCCSVPPLLLGGGAAVAGRQRRGRCWSTRRGLLRTREEGGRLERQKAAVASSLSSASADGGSGGRLSRDDEGAGAAVDAARRRRRRRWLGTRDEGGDGRGGGWPRELRRVQMEWKIGGGWGSGGAAGRCYSHLRDEVSSVDPRSSILASQPGLAESSFPYESGSAELDRAGLPISKLAV